MRGRMSDGPSYAAPVAIGAVMVGGTVSRVSASRHGDFKAGQLVLGFSGWQDYALSDGKGLTALFPEQPHPSRALGVLGMPGFTAYTGLLDIGRRVPVCGMIAAYNATALPPGPDRLGLLVGTLLRKRIKMQGFIVFDDYGPRWDEFAGEMG